jgi:signal transduction histidine kinase
VLRTREPMLVTDVDEARLASFAQDAEHLKQMQALGVSSFVLVPLVARGREIGAIGLVSTSPERPFTTEDLDVANDLAVRAALAADNARLYRSAQEADQAKSNLLAVISHDLRTPLNSIMGHVELLAMGLPDKLSDGSLQRVERIRLSAAHLVYLIDELLSFARLDGGHEKLRVQEIDACTIAHEVASVVEPLAEARSIAFETELPDAQTLVASDPDRLRQVLLNLLGNAIKYTDSGTVRLTLHTTEKDICWEISDTGVGIDPAHLDRIFEPFWQADPTQRARNGGTGLGLSVVRRLVRLLGGTITVRSDVGRGSTFRVRLPRQLVSPQPDP